MCPDSPTEFSRDKRMPGASLGSCDCMPQPGVETDLVTLAATRFGGTWVGSSAAVSATGIAVDGSWLYVAGTTSGLLACFSGTQDAFVRKFSAAGGVLWTIQFGSTSAADQATGITADASGIYVSGNTSGA